MMYLFYAQTLSILAVFPFAKEVKVNGTVDKVCIKSAGSEDRCFYMPLKNLTWKDAQNECSSADGISFLASDNIKAAHEAMHTVMKNNGIDRAWIGGKVKGLYWNWTPSKFDRTRRSAHPLYLQGCYDVGAPSVKVNTTNSVANCSSRCKEQNRSYFMLRRKGKDSFECQCSDTVSGTGSTDCSFCDGGTGEKEHICGNGNRTAAIYTVDQLPGDTAPDCESINRWKLWSNDTFPTGVNEKRGCMTYSSARRCRRLGAKSCYSDTMPVVCSSITDNATCPQKFTSRESYCYSLTSYTWGDAIKACPNDYEMVAVYDDDIRRKLDLVLNTTRLHEFWIRGTSRRWLWHKCLNDLKDVKPPTDDTVEPPPLDESCLVMTLVDGSARWNSSNCTGEKMHFLCETTKKDNITSCSSLLQSSSPPPPSEPVTTNETVPVENSPPLPLIIGLTLGICVLVLLLVIMGYFIIARRRKLQGKANASNGSVKNLKTRNGQVQRERVNNNYQKSSMKNTYKSDGHKKQRKEKKAKKGTVLHHLLFIKAAARKHKEIHTERVSCETHKGIIEEKFRDYETVQYDQIYAIPQKKSKPKPGSTKNTEEEDNYQLAEPVKQAISQTFSDNQRIPVKDLILLFNDHIKTLKTKEEKAISDLAVAVLPRGDETEMVPNDIYNLIPEDLSRSLKATHAQQAEIFRQQVETDYVLDDLQMMENDIYVAVEDIYAIPVRKNKEKYSETKAIHSNLRNPSDVAPTDHIREVVETNFGLQQKLSVKELIDMFENHKTKLQEKRQEALLDIADTFVEQATHMEENILYGESPWMAEAGNTIQEEYEIFDLQDNPIYQSREDASSEEEKYEDVSYFELNRTADDSVGGRDQIDAVVDNLRKMKPDSAVSFSDTILHNDSIRKRVQDKFGDVNRIPVKSLIALFNEQNMDFNQICSQEMIEIPTQESVPTEQSGGFDEENEYAEINDV